MNRIGIEFLSVFNLPPVEFVHLAADLGCHHISSGLISIPINPHNYPEWSLRDDPALRRGMIAAMRERDVSISLGEGFSVRAGMDVRDRAADLAQMVELGVRRINTISLDPDLSRSFDQFALLAEMAAATGVETTVEFGPGMTIDSLTTAVSAIRHVGRADFRLLVDTMHLVRSGSTAADIRALDPNMIGYAQLCDVPLVASNPSYMEEAMFERMTPGHGELPLADIIAALPSDVVLGLEIPQRAVAEAGENPHQYVGRYVEAARALIDNMTTTT